MEDERIAVLLYLHRNLDTENHGRKTGTEKVSIGGHSTICVREDVKYYFGDFVCNWLIQNHPFWQCHWLALHLRLLSLFIAALATQYVPQVRITVRNQ